MTTALVFDQRESPVRRDCARNGLIGLLASGLLHALMVALLLGWPRPPPPPEEPQGVTVDLVQPPPAPKPEIQPEPPKPEPKPEAPPPPEPPKPEAKAPPKPSLAPLFPLPPKVRTQPGKLADKPAAGETVKDQTPGQVPPKSDEAAPGSESRTTAQGHELKGPGAAQAAQTARDILLSAVFEHFSLDPRLRGQQHVISLGVEVEANGMLGRPFAADHPDDLQTAWPQLRSLPANDLRRRTMEDLDRAIRAAQPFHLPPALAFRAPFVLRLDFRLDDAP